MAICPDGHDSVSEDYCDVCGMRIGGAAAGSAPVTSGQAAYPPSADRGSTSSATACPQCDSPKTPGAFCEVCGYNFASGAPPQSTGSASQPPPSGPSHSLNPSPATHSTSATAPPISADAWTAVVAADRGYYETMQAATGGDGADIPFPPYCPERRFQLAGSEMRIGRRSPSRGLEPEIDLTGPPTDPGISRLHAVLIATPDGAWAVLDPGSANGTQVNGTDIPTSRQIPLHDGDRISLGAWTTITIHTA